MKSMKRQALLAAFILLAALQALAGERWVVTDRDLTVWDSPEYQNKLGMVHAGYEIDAVGLEGGMIHFLYDGRDAYVSAVCCAKAAPAPQAAPPSSRQPAAVKSAGAQAVETDTSGQPYASAPTGATEGGEFNLDNLPAWQLAVLALCVLVGLACGLFWAVSCVFAGYYAFSYPKLRAWPNRRCGTDCIPAKRLNAQLKAPLLAIILMVAAQYIVFMPLVALFSTTGARLVAVATAAIVLPGIPFVVLRRAYRRNRTLYGPRAARYLMLYALLGVAAIYVICAIAVVLVFLVIIAWASTLMLKESQTGGALSTDSCTCANCKHGPTVCSRAPSSGRCPNWER